MASIINSIAFKNFYNFYGDYKDNAYNFKAGLNIINADNGMGKSKIFNGFLWILEDMVYDSDTRKKESVKIAALKMLSEKAKKETVSECGVQIVFQDEHYKYCVNKTIKFSQNSNPQEPWKIDILPTDMSKENLVNHVASVVYDKDTIESIIKERLITPAMQSYSLLQGEAIDEIVDLSNSTKLSATIENLTDISEIKEIELTCKSLSSSSQRILENKQKSCSQNKNEFERAQQEKEDVLKQINQTEASLNQYKSEQKTATEIATELGAKLANTEKRVEFREKYNRLVQEKRELENKLNSLLVGITDRLFKKPFPWILYGTNGFFDAYNEKWAEYSEALTTKKIINNPHIIASILPEGSPDDASLDRMLKECHCLVCDRSFEKGDEHYKHVEMLRNRSLQQKDCPIEDKFKNFFSGIMNNVAPYMKVDMIYGNIAGCRMEISTLGNNIKKKEEEIKRTFEEFANYGGSQDDLDNTCDSNLLAKYNKAENDRNRLQRYIIDAQKRISELNEKLERCEKKMSECGGAAVPQSYKDFKEILHDIQGVFNRTKERIYNEVLDTLEQKSNVYYQSLTKGNNVDGGKLTFFKTSYDAIQLKVINESGNEFTGASEGFQRMKKIAVVMAIVSSKIGGGHFDYPFIADAPFSAFGKNFITNFFNTVPDVFRQCIIMIKDLYDVNDIDCLSEDGKKILNEMRAGNIKGTFYVNCIEEVSDPTKMVTIIKQYV